MKNQKQGFLLIGLLIAVAIIAIIFTIIYGGDQTKNTKNLENQKNSAQTKLNESNTELNNYQQELNNQGLNN